MLDILGLGLKASIETIDNRGDFKVYMQNYAYARGPAVHRGPRREGPSDEGFVGRHPFLLISKLSHLLCQLPPLPSHHGVVPNIPPNAVNGIQDKGRPTFGVDLAEQMARDNVEVPTTVTKCCQAIEKYGMQTQGIYRISGTTSKVANLRQRLDKGLLVPSVKHHHACSNVSNSDLEAVDLDAPEWSGDIHNVTSVLKMWLRELPDPLLTFNLHQGFIEAAST